MAKKYYIDFKERKKLRRLRDLCNLRKHNSITQSNYYKYLFWKSLYEIFKNSAIEISK